MISALRNTAALFKFKTGATPKVTHQPTRRPDSGLTHKVVNGALDSVWGAMKKPSGAYQKVNAKVDPRAQEALKRAEGWKDLHERHHTERIKKEITNGADPRGDRNAWCARFVSSAYKNKAPWGHQKTVRGILKWGQKNKGHYLSAKDSHQRCRLLSRLQARQGGATGATRWWVLSKEFAKGGVGADHTQ